MCLEPLASSTEGCPLGPGKAAEVLKAIAALSSPVTTCAISTWEWGSGRASTSKAAGHFQEPPSPRDYMTINDLYSPRLRKRNRAHSHSHHTKKKQRIRVSLFMCICYRQTDKDRWSHHPTPAPGEAVHRLLHTCGSPAAAHSVSDQLWWQLWRWGVSSDGSQEAEGGQEGPEMSRGQRVRLEGSSCSQARAQSRKAATRKLTSGPWQRELGEVRAAPECPN